MSKRLIALVMGGLVIVQIAAGCGGGGSDSASISRAEFIKQADAVCVKTEEQMSSGLQSLVASYEGKEPRGAALAAAQAKLVETVMVPSKRKEAEQLRGVGAPHGDEEQVEAITDALEEGTKEAEGNPEEAVQGQVRSFTRAEKLARQYGLKGC